MHELAVERDTLGASTRTSGEDDDATGETLRRAPSGERLVENRSRAEVAATEGPISTSWRIAAAAAATGVESGPHTARTVESLHLQEVGMSQRYVRVAIPFALFGLFLIPWIGGHPLAKVVYASGMAAIIGASLWLAWRMRDPAGYTIERSMKSAIANLYGGFALVYFFGVFSSACMVMPFGVYFFTLKQNDRATRALFVVSIVVYGLLAAGVVVGLLPDVGVLSSDRLGTSDRVVMALLAETTLVVTFLVARATRANVRHAVEHQDRLVRDLARRETLLAEARDDLRRALETGRFGRFTDVVMGSYRLGAVLGRGGMGEVYDAAHVETGAPAAVKVLHARVLARPDAVRAFLREIRVIAAIDSPHVVRVLEVGGADAELGRHDAEFPYVAMERLRGRTLSEALRERKRLSLPAVIELVAHVAEGLDALRAAGVVHRDIKPGNLYCAESATGERAWKILDLGIARCDGSPEDGRLVGTPGYMAPEQLDRGRASHQTDVYALALVAYRALTGQPAFDGRGHRSPAERLRPPSELVQVPPVVDRALASALALDPSERPTALALARALSRAAPAG